MVVLNNLYSTTTQGPIAEALAALAFGERPAVATDIAPVKLPPAVLEPYAGRYSGGPEFFFPGALLTVRGHDGHLTMHWSTGADSILVPLSKTEFLDRSFWARVSLGTNEKGEVTGLSWRYAGKEYPAKRLGE